MSHSNKIQLALATAMLMCQAIAFAKCDLNVGIRNFIGEVAAQEQASPHTFSVSTSSNSANCRRFQAYFGKGNANSYNRRVSMGSKTINYNIYKENAMNTVLKDFGDAGSGEFFYGELDQRNTDYSFNFYLKLIDLDSVFSNGPGYYHDLIPISFYSIKANGDLIYERTVYMNVTIVIPRFAELSLGAPGSSHNPSSTSHLLDLGYLESNEVGYANLTVKGNVGFGIYMASQNGGLLKKGNAGIPYQVKIGNLAYQSLGSPGVNYYMTQRDIATGQGGESYPIAVQIGNVPEDAESGDYDDVITVTVTAW